jgi:hypothetical protein
MEWDPALVSVMTIMPMVDDRWRLRRDSVVQVAIFTARFDGYLVGRRWRMRVGVEN